MLPADYPLVLYRGDTGRWRFKLWSDAAKTQPVDLTGVTVDAMVRDKVDNGTFSMSMTCAVTVPNIIDMLLTSTQSRDLTPKGFWDLQLTYASGDVVTVLKGPVSVTSDVTHTPVAAKKLVAVR